MENNSAQNNTDQMMVNQEGQKKSKPNKKWLVLGVLGLLIVAVVGAVYYFATAANTSPIYFMEIEKQDGDKGELDEENVMCGEQFDIHIFVNADVTDISDTKGIVAATAFVEFDENTFRVDRIDTTNSSFATDVVENIGNGYVEVSRGQPAPGIIKSNPAIDRLHLATLKVTVLDNVKGDKQFKIGKTGTRKSFFIRSGGANLDPNYTLDNTDTKDGVYDVEVKCCISPDDTCELTEICPANNWEDQSIRCCNDPCIEGNLLYFDPQIATRDEGDYYEVDLKIMSQRADWESGKITIEFDDEYLNIDPDGDGNPNVSLNNTFNSNITVDLVSSGVLEIEISGIDYEGLQYEETRIASLFFLTDLPDSSIEETAYLYFRDDTTSPTGETKLWDDGILNGSVQEMEVAYGQPDLGSSHSARCTIVKQSIDLCQDTDVVVTPYYDSVDFYWCTDPGSNCDIQVNGDIKSESGGNYEVYHSIERWKPAGVVPGSGNQYDYEIQCNRKNYRSLNLNGKFSLKNVDDLSIFNIVEENITSRSAIVSWLTTGGDKGDGKATSEIYYRKKGESTWSNVVNNFITKAHTLTLVGLNPESEYEYFVMSRTDKAVTCTHPAGEVDESFGATCSYSEVRELMTESSDTDPDVNMVIKVNRDRVCDEWLYCNASVEQLNSKMDPPRYEDVCFGVGVCGEVDEQGRCIEVIDEEASATVYNHPGQVNMIENLSGYSRVGLDWGRRCLNTGNVCDDDSDCGTGAFARCPEAGEMVAGGSLPFSKMKEVGMSVTIPNSGFEDMTVRPWEELGEVNINISREGSNSVLEISPKERGQGAYIESLASNIRDQVYVLTLRAKSAGRSDDAQQIVPRISYCTDYDNTKCEPQTINFSYYDKEDGLVKNYIPLKPYWDEYILTLDMGAVDDLDPKSDLRLQVVQTPSSGGEMATFYIDNLAMKSVLKTSEESGDYVARSCRMYPTANAPSCDYYDRQLRKNYYGWKGYCVEPDPAYPEASLTGHSVCLQWWPVDIIQGESNVFGEEEPEQYTGRKPLYYCLEAGGNYARSLSYTDLNSMFDTVVGDRYTIKIDNFNIKSNDSESFAETDMYFNSDTLLYPEQGPLFRLRREDIVGVEINAGKFFDVKANFLGDNRSYEEVDSLMPYQGYHWLDTANSKDWVFYATEYEYDDWEPSSATPTVSGNNACSENDTGNAMVVRFYFSKEGNELNDVKFFYCDDEKDTNDLNIDIDFILREPCYKIAKVVTQDGDTVPWTARLNSDGFENDNWIGYAKNQDATPFGAIINPFPEWSPEDWQTNGQPLYVSPPKDEETYYNNGMGRAGSPYGTRYGEPVLPNISGNSEEALGICLSDNRANDYCMTNVYCDNDSDCGDYIYSGLVCKRNRCSRDLGSGDKCENNESCLLDASEIKRTVAFGPPICVTGSNIGSDCGYGCGYDLNTQKEGECAGFQKPENGYEWNIPFKDDDDSTSGSSWEHFNYFVSSRTGKDALSQLFAKSYGVWEWKYDDKVDRYRYVKIEDGWDITDRGSKPAIKNILVNNSIEDYVIVKSGSAILKFDSLVDRNQTPLVRYSVNWGDGTEVSETGIKIAGKTIEDPHILAHHYFYSDDTSGCDPGGINGFCEFDIKVQIEDNWGRCDTEEGGVCADLDKWKKFPGKIRVYPDYGSVPDQEIEVTPQAISLDTEDDLVADITLKNSPTALSNVEWSIDEPLVWTKNGSVQTGTVDYSFSKNNGILAMGGQYKITFRINSVDFDISDDPYLSEIKIVGDNGKTAIVNVQLKVGGDPWWDSAWKNRIKIDLDDYNGGSLANVPIGIRLSDMQGVGFHYGDVKEQGEDLRFVDQDGNNFDVLDYEIEYFERDNDNSAVWVLLPEVGGNSVDGDYIYMYYNNPSATDAQNPSVVWSRAGYEAVYHLSEYGNNQREDSTGNGHDSSHASDFTTEDALGVIGFADRLGQGSDSKTKELRFADNDNLDFGVDDDFTIEYWTKYGTLWANGDGGGYPPSSGEYVDILSKNADFDNEHSFLAYDESGGDSMFGYGFYLDNNGRGDLKFRVNSGGYYREIGNMDLIDGNSENWYHVVGVMDWDDDVKLYVNGNESDDTTSSNADIDEIDDLSNESEFILGDRYYYRGILDEVRVSRSARSEDWIDFSYCTSNPSRSSNCIEYKTKEDYQN